MTPFLIFGSKSAKKELRNRLFHKPFEPGSEMDPRKLFWAPKGRKRSPETICFVSLLSEGAQSIPKSVFGVQKCIFGTFGAQNRILASKNALLDPKSHFGAHFAPWPKRLMKQRVSGTFFRTLGAKTRKWAHFAHFGVPKWKMSSFSDFLTLFHPKR